MLFDPNGLIGVEPLDKKRAKVLLLFGIHKFFYKKMHFLAKIVKISKG